MSSLSPSDAHSKLSPSDIPRPEYPRPQFVREDWINLNGLWEFEIDQADSGIHRDLVHARFSRKILVPFCPESSLSGIGHTDFLRSVWYRRRAQIPSDWAGRQVILHFGAVDYDATVWINGIEAGRHRGGFTPFSVGCGPFPDAQDIEIVVRAREPDDTERPAGKQSIASFANVGCLYTRTTGIWQTVWMEPVNRLHFSRRPRIVPDVGRKLFSLELSTSQNSPGQSVRASLLDADGAELCTTERRADTDFSTRLDLTIPDNAVRLWEPGNAYLYSIALELRDASGQVVDRITSYAGLRSVTLDGQRVLINGRPVFQRLVLDQGFYPDGIMTAPSDADLVHDIELAMEVGFNGARLHQKVFEERFLYHADRLGYLVWGEFGDWGLRIGEALNRSGRYSDPMRHQGTTALVRQWLEVLERDFSHPAIIGWCPLNETRQNIEDHLTSLDDMTHATFLACKAMDLTRPVLDASGYAHRVPETDVYDSHDYEQSPEVFAERHDQLSLASGYSNSQRWNLPYAGQPYFVSEFGGTWWNPIAAAEAAADKSRTASWGYGNRPSTVEEFLSRFEGLCTTLLRNPHMFGYCYTQLTDVFQEQNGIFNFDRSRKFDSHALRNVQQQPAAIEQSPAVPILTPQ